MAGISFVVPVHNEEESLQAFYKELLIVCKKLGKCEIIFVDDGSTDRSLVILKSFLRSNKRIAVYSFRKNQGKAEALTFAFQKAKEDSIVTLDADLQDKPSEVQRLLPFIKKYDLVCGWRRKRKDTLVKKIFSKMFNDLARVLWGLQLHDYNCGLKVYKKEAAKAVRLYGGLHRFIPLLVYEQGFSVTEVPVVHARRQYGKSKYAISKIWTELPDIFTVVFLSKYASKPLHFFGGIGLLLFATGAIILLYIAIIKFTTGVIGERPILFLGMVLVISGLQAFFTGFLADMMINIHKKDNIEYRTPGFLKYASEKK